MEEYDKAAKLHMAEVRSAELDVQAAITLESTQPEETRAEQSADELASEDAETREKRSLIAKAFY